MTNFPDNPQNNSQAQTAFNDILRSESPIATDEPLLLFAAEVDDPLHYLFETGGWRETYGASRQLSTLEDKFRAALVASGVMPDVLHADSGRIMTLLPANTDAAALLKRIARIPPELTGKLTVSAMTHRLTVRQLLSGPYRAPVGVIGIPGVTSYQARINRYFGLDSQSSVPTLDAVAARHHFGEVIALSRQLIGHERESRVIVPFYECLPFAERCAACHTRPAERLIQYQAICGICWRKRQAAIDAPPILDQVRALIALRVPNMDRLLEAQRPPAAYRRMAATLTGALRRAASGSGGLAVWQSADCAWVAAPVDTALDVAQRAALTFAALTREVIREPLHIGVCAGYAAPEHLAQGARAALAETFRDGDPIALATGGHITRYAPDDLDRLQRGIHALATAQSALTPFADLATHITQQTASMYYVYGRARMTDDQRRPLDAIEGEWGKNTPRFYRALNDMIGLLGSADADSHA